MGNSLVRFGRAVFTTMLVTITVVAVQACGDDDEAGGDPAASCDSMCKGAGFTTSRISTQAHETNCFCSGGTGSVTAAACTEMCKSTGKPGSPFGTGPNACQCQ